MKLVRHRPGMAEVEGSTRFLSAHWVTVSFPAGFSTFSASSSQPGQRQSPIFIFAIPIHPLQGQLLQGLVDGVRHQAAETPGLGGTKKGGRLP